MRLLTLAAPFHRAIFTLAYVIVVVVACILVLRTTPALHDWLAAVSLSGKDSVVFSAPQAQHRGEPPVAPARLHSEYDLIRYFWAPPDDLPVWDHAPAWDAASWGADHPLAAPGALVRSLALPAADCAWPTLQHLLLDTNDTVRIMVIGGSMTFGSGCGGDMPAILACRWPTAVAMWVSRALVAAGARGRIHFVNRAQGGIGAHAWAASAAIYAGEFDAYVIDVSVNHNGASSRDVTRSLDALLWRVLHTRGRHLVVPAVLLVETFRHMAESGKEMRECDATQQHRNQGMVWCTQWWRVSDDEAGVARHYGLPVASYRDAVWPVMEAPPRDLPRLWTNRSDDSTHPPKGVHALVADVVKYALAALLGLHADADTDAVPSRVAWRMQRRGLHPNCSVDGERVAPLVPATSLSAVNVVCLSRGPPLSLYAPPIAGASSFQPMEPVPRGWSLVEDRMNKLGWIAYAGATDGPLSFMVSFSSARPRLEVTFMRSYNTANQTWGAADVSLDGCGTWRVDALWHPISFVSLPVMLEVTTPGGGQIVPHHVESQQFACTGDSTDPANTTRIVRIAITADSSPGAKFKLLSVASC